MRQRGFSMHIGAVAAIAAALSLAGAKSAGADVFIVNSTGDESDLDSTDSPRVCDVGREPGEQCTLRAALEEAQGADSSRINFSIPGDGVHTIAPQTPLPVITSPVEIDGYSQPGTGPNTRLFGQPLDAALRIELDGAAVAGASGLVIGPNAVDSSISGLVINRFGLGGIEVKAEDATIQGNFVGTNAAGTRDLGTGGDAVFGFGGSALVGGDASSERNLLSGNGGDGVGTNAPITVQGNYIGTRRDGRSPLGNDGDGVGLFSGRPSPVGGFNEARNIIAFNGDDGVALFNPSKGTTITQNRIYANGDLGIDFEDDGVTPNDRGDGDGGPNDQQNFPVLKSAVKGSRHTNVAGKLSSTPNASFTLDFYGNEAHGNEGRRFLGSHFVTTDGAGNTHFTFTTKKPVHAGDNVTATATNIDNSTSEFSAPQKVTSG